MTLKIRNNLREYSFTLLFILIVFLLHHNFEYWIISFLDDNSKFFETEWSDYVILLLCSIVFAYLVFFLNIRHYTNRIKSKPIPKRTKKTILWIIAWTVYYSHQRLGIILDSSLYYPQFFIRNITFLDLIAYLPIIHFLTSLIIRNDKLHSNASNLINDVPIKDEDSDVYYRTKLASNLASEILNFYDPDYSFVIGIEGDWGNGKSSFLRLIERSISEEEKILLIKFNAWQYSSNDNLTLNFLNELRSKLITKTGINDYHIKNIIKKMFVDGSFLKFVSEFFNPSDLETLKRELSHDIVISNIKIVVIIDDFDRLEKNELLETLNIIRNVGNIGNMIYLLAYDKKHILSTLDDSKNNYTEYLSKFIQLEISLGNIPETTIESYFENELRKHFSLQIDAYENAIKSVQTIQVNDPSIRKKEFKNIDGLNLIRNKRDAIKIVNYLAIQYKLLEQSLIFIEYLQLTILKVRFPIIYAAIRNGDIFIDDLLQGTYDLDDDKINDLILDFLPNEKMKVKNLLYSLFPKNKEVSPQYSINSKSGFDAYFKNELYGELNIQYLNALFNEI